MRDRDLQTAAEAQERGPGTSSPADPRPAVPRLSGRPRQRLSGRSRPTAEGIKESEGSYFRDVGISRRAVPSWIIFLIAPSRVFFLARVTKLGRGGFYGYYQLEGPASGLHGSELQKERKQMKAQEDPERMWNLLVHNIPDVVVIHVARDGTILSLNQTRIPDLKVEDAIGTSVYDWVLPEHHEIMRRSLEKVFRTGKPDNYEVIGTGPGGPNTSWYETRLVPNVSGGRLDSVIMISTDVTERKKAVSELRMRDRAVETSISGIAFIDLAGKLSYANPSFLRLWGFDDLDEVRGSSVLELWESKAEARAALEAVLDGRSWSGELVARKKDGSLADMRASVNAARDHEGRMLCGMGTFLDITAEKKLRASAAQSDRLASMGMLAAGVAHEINNPLAYMFLSLEGLRKELLEISGDARDPSFAGQDTRNRPGAAGDRSGIFVDFAAIDKLVKKLEVVITGAELVRDIVSDMKTFSRVEEDCVVPLSLNKAIDTAANMVQHEVRYRARLAKEYGNIPDVMGNDGRIAQVFLNLILNAALAIDEGNAENNEIRIRTWSGNGEVLAEVRDTGKGIPAEDLDRLFDPFFTTRPVGVGSGLGLSICHRIITAYGGRIEVISKVGEGARFLVRLPAASMEETRPAAPEPPGGEAGYPAVHGRILLVDDDSNVRQGLGLMLEADHEVVTAASGEESRRILERDAHFDVILCDLMMSRGTGMDLYEWLLGRHPDLARRMVFMTGGVFTPRARDFLARIPNPFLEKPFAPGSIEKTLRELIIAAKG